jgi:hypothetical protein
MHATADLVAEIDVEAANAAVRRLRVHGRVRRVDTEADDARFSRLGGAGRAKHTHCHQAAQHGAQKFCHVSVSPRGMANMLGRAVHAAECGRGYHDRFFRSPRTHPGPWP